MKIYLDTCCWGRKRDDSSVARNAAEAVAVDWIMDLCRDAGDIIVGSSVVESEIMDNPNVAGRDADMKLFAESIGSYDGLSDSDRVRAKVFQSAGLKVNDSYHLAIAERAGVDVLITVDDDFERVATDRQLSDVSVTNPLKFLMEVFL